MISQTDAITVKSLMESDIPLMCLGQSLDATVIGIAKTWLFSPSVTVISVTGLFFLSINTKLQKEA